MSQQGVATAWPVFSAPCEACTLTLELCYSRAGTTAATVDVAKCLEIDPANPYTAKSDLKPEFADRTKTTKPFHVAKANPTRVQVYNQRVPSPPEDHPATGSAPVVKVGQVFDVQLETVELFGGAWSMQSAGSS
eukprot:gene3874-21498_t